MDKPPRPSRSDVFLNYKIWLSGLVGHGQIQSETFALLEAIRNHETLKSAADSLGLSYRKAWGQISEAEQILGYSLLVKQRGGKEGGKSSLTSSAIKLLEAYRALQQRFDESVEAAYTDFINKLNNG